MQRRDRSMPRRNEWRLANVQNRPDLCTADLSGAHLNAADLSEANLSHASLMGAVLINPGGVGSISLVKASAGRKQEIP